MLLFLPPPPPVGKAFFFFFSEAEGVGDGKNFWSSNASDPVVHGGSFAQSTPQLWVTGPLPKPGPC